MKDKLEILFWRFAKYLLFKGYGYCDEREEGCGCCAASEVQDWIDCHIELLRDW